MQAQSNGTHAPRSNGIFEPPSGILVSAISYNKLLILACSVLVALVGVGYGVIRQPVYTASASLQIGQVNPNSPGFLGYVQSASALAAAFSRSVAAEPVLEEIDSKLGVRKQAAVSRLSAEPIPLSPVFRVIATGSSSDSAMNLANVASTAIVKYEAESNSANPQATSLLSDYRNAALEVQRAKNTLNRLTTEGADTNEVLVANAEKTAAQVKLKAAGNAYNAAIISQAPRNGLVTIIAGATSAANDRKSKIELFGFIGLLIGALLGCGLAVFREHRLAAIPASSGRETSVTQAQA